MFRSHLLLFCTVHVAQIVTCISHFYFLYSLWFTLEENRQVQRHDEPTTIFLRYTLKSHQLLVFRIQQRSATFVSFYFLRNGLVSYDQNHHHLLMLAIKCDR
jgi:hypothetical protein